MERCKDSQQKISVVTFAAIHQAATGAGQKALAIAKRFYQENRLHRLVCRAYDERGTGLPRDVYLVPGSKRINQFARRVLPSISRISGSSDRRVQEELFDFFVSRNRTVMQSTAVLFLKPGFPRAVLALKAENRKTLGFASILHPQFNYQQVSKEATRLNLTSVSSYTDTKRVNKLKRFFHGLDCLMVPSSLAKDIYQQFGVAHDRIAHLKDTYGVDCQKFCPPEHRKTSDRFRVLHVSYMTLIKGLAYLFEAWKDLALPNSELILGGSVDQNIRALLNEHQTATISTVGPISNTASLYQEADVFVSSSISDNIPNTVLEAMASGVPVICSNMCGASEVIDHGIDGFVYQYDSLDELRYYLQWCHSNRSALTTMGRKARVKASMHQQGDFAKNVVTHVDRYLNQWNGNRR